MKISDIGEFGLIERIRRSGARRAGRALVGIGDDAAELLVSPDEALLATTDLLLEGVHFDLRTTDLFSLGWKAAAVNLSDIAAMGGLPRYCLTALGIPAGATVEAMEEFYRGVRACLEKFDTELVGGDTCRSRKGFCISVTLLGETLGGKAITRSGAAPGDRVFVTGTLGDSAAGLELMNSLSGGSKKTSSPAGKLMERHLRPVPRVIEGMKLAAEGIASAMIDVSDGLSSDLAHICEARSVGARVFAEQLPLSKELLSMKRLKRPALHYALSGGEDYELLFTVPPDRMRKLKALRIGASEIGVIEPGGKIMLSMENGREVPLPPSGYDHFRGASRTTGSRG